MNIKKLIKQFNTSDTYLIISDYPESTKKGSKNYGIAWYTREVIEPIAREHNTRFVVLAEKGYDNKPQVYADGKILVLRVFDQKHPTLFPRILKWMLQFNKIKEVHVHSEFCVNGGVKNVLLVAPFLLLIKLFRKHITYYAHNVVTDFSNIATHFNLKKNSLKFKFFGIGLKIYYFLLGIIVNQFVVMDEAIKHRLARFVSEKKIFLNPFWVTEEKDDMQTEQQARARLGIKKHEFVLLYFGFVTYYKGADWLIRTVSSLQKRKQFSHIRLIIAGGPAYSLKDKQYYQKYYQEVTMLAKKAKNITITGFVEDDDVSMYFKAANLVVFSYRGLIGGSASFLHALKYRKPFLLSSYMHTMLENDAIKEILHALDVTKHDFLFSYTQQSFADKLKLVQDPRVKQNMQAVTTAIATSRSKQTLLQNCYTKLYAPRVTSTGFIKRLSTISLARAK